MEKKEEKSVEKYLNVMTNYKRMASNLISDMASFENWSDGFCRDQIKELYAKLIKYFDGCDFTQFTVDELKKLDFQWFDEDLLCMPSWVIDCLIDGTELHSISDGDVIIFDKSKGLDKDTRFGATAYGFNKSQLRDSTINRVLDKDE